MSGGGEANQSERETWYTAQTHTALLPLKSSKHTILWLRASGLFHAWFFELKSRLEWVFFFLFFLDWEITHDAALVWYFHRYVTHILTRYLVISLGMVHVKLGCVDGVQNGPDHWLDIDIETSPSLHHSVTEEILKFLNPV